MADDRRQVPCRAPELPGPVELEPVDFELELVDFELELVDFELEPVDCELELVDFVIEPVDFEFARSFAATVAFVGSGRLGEPESPAQLAKDADEPPNSDLAAFAAAD